jgi:hypothetical protein
MMSDGIVLPFIHERFTLMLQKILDEDLLIHACAVGYFFFLVTFA